MTVAWGSASLLALPRVSKRLVLIVTDVSLCILSIWFAYYLRLNMWVPIRGGALIAAMISVMLVPSLLGIFRLYHVISRYIGARAFIGIAQAIAIYGVVFWIIVGVITIPGVPRTIGLIQPLLLLLLIFASRALARYWLGGLYKEHLPRRPAPRVLIYGAGSGGRQLAAVLVNSKEMRVVGFLDDEPALQGRTLNGIAVYDPRELDRLVHRLSVADVLLAIPSASRARRNQILARLREAGVAVRTLPGLLELAQGTVHASDLRELDVLDLLGRDVVEPNEAWNRRNLAGRVVLVTGAGGSIGSELCRQILAARPSVLLLVDNSEYALYAVHRALLGSFEQANGQTVVVPLLASVTDANRMRDVMRTWRPSIVYHAAAYKHVPLVEHNPLEGIRNNAFGTWITAKAAIDEGVENFVLISTDKAVRPTNVMGATKRLAEIVLQALNERPRTTRLSMVRFGNVLGSSGSVVPLFRQQIRDGGPVTITHPDITRYFMTIPEAVQLVLHAGAMAQGGEVFLLEMGEPVRVLDLARNMIKLSGLTVRDEQDPDGDIAIEVIGLRPGEKLFEELLIGNDPRPTSHPRIMMASEAFPDWMSLEPRLIELSETVADRDVGRARALLVALVEDFKPNSEIVDWVHLERKAVIEGRRDVA